VFDEFINQMILIVLLERRVLDASAQMISNNLRPHSTDCPRNGDDLTQDLDTIFVILNHSAQSSDLAFNSVKPLDQALLVLIGSA
jgi:hypothetical protein